MDKVIALDIGGVCVQLHHEQAMAQMGIASMDKLPEAFMFACIQLECGMIDDLEWLAVSRECFPQCLEKSDNEIYAIFNSAIGVDIPGSAALARRLVKEGYRLVYFSNTSRMHALEVARKLSFAPLITGAVYSFEAGHMKPEPRIYEIFEEQYGVPDYYFDDRAENIEAAKERGWNCQLFTTAEAAEKFIFG